MDFLRRLLKPADSAPAPAAKTIPKRPDSLSSMVTGAPAPIITPPDTPLSPVDAVSIERPPAAITRPPVDEFGTKPLDKFDAERDITPSMLAGFGRTRPLPPIEPYVRKPGKHLEYGLNSDIGQQRSNNQDSLLTFFTSNISVEERPDFGLFVVADGMGGHHDGEKASAITTRIVAEYIINKLYMNMLTSPASESGGDRPTVSETLSEAIQSANNAVSEQIPEGGTTVTAVIVLGDLAYVGHVGDSRAYLITDDVIEQITRDHSLVQRLIELDQLTPEEAAVHPQKNVLYRAIGQTDNLEVDALTRRLPHGARLLICSDGLWNQVPEDLLAETVRTAKTPQEACDRLIAIANDRGGPDNITAVLVQTPG